jgi:hypothetical protein
MKDETGAECDDIMEGTEITATPQKAVEIIPDCVCPICFKPTAYPRIEAVADRYGREIRQCLEFCTACKLGSEMVQFKRDGWWVTYKYQVNAYVGELTHCQASGKWVTLNDLPEPAPVVTGPGGEYDKQITLTEQDVMLLSTLRRGLESFSVALEWFMRHFGLKE